MHRSIIVLILLCMFVTFNVLVADPVPEASVVPSNPLAFQFTSPIVGDGETTFLWDFGDGSTSALENPQHTYSYPGLYYVILVLDGGVPSKTSVQAGHETEYQSFEVWPPDPALWTVTGNMDVSSSGAIVGAKGVWNDLTDPETTCTSPSSSPYSGGGKGDAFRSWVITTLVNLDQAPAVPETWLEFMSMHDDALNASIFGAKLQYKNGGYEILAYAMDNSYPSVTHEFPWQPVVGGTLRIELQGWIKHPGLNQDGGMRLRVLDIASNTEVVNLAMNQLDNDQLSIDRFNYGNIGSKLGPQGLGGVRLDEARALSDTCLPASSTDLVGHWDFDDPNQLGLDSSGNGRDGTVVGGATSVVGRPRTPLISEFALSLDGTGYVQIPSLGEVLSGAEEMTLEAWVQVASHGQMNVFRSQQPLGLHSNKFVVSNYIQGTGWETLSASPAPPTNTWYHVAGVFDHGTLDLYVDGVLVGQRTLNFTALQGTTYLNWAIGARLPGALGPDQFFVGQVDDVKLYRRALSKTEIEAEAGLCSG